MEVNLASVEELRCDIQAIRERLGEQVSGTERSLHEYIEFELLKAQSYLKNVSEKLAAHIEGDARTDGQGRHKFKDLPARSQEDSPTESSSFSLSSSFSSSSSSSSHQSEAKAAQLDSDKSPKQKLTEANGCPPASRKMSRCDEGRGRSSNRSAVEGTNQASKVPGKSPLPKSTEKGRAPKVHLNGKRSQWHQEGHQGPQQSSALQPADVDNMSGSRKQQQPNHKEPKSRETNPKRHSLSSEPESQEKVNVTKFATVRLPMSINSSNNMNFTNVKTRFMRRHQDDEVRALFGL